MVSCLATRPKANLGTIDMDDYDQLKEALEELEAAAHTQRCQQGALQELVSAQLRARAVLDNLGSDDKEQYAPFEPKRRYRVKGRIRERCPGKFLDDPNLE